ncbi:MAG: ASKHA domain-containing protein, partial [Candidatus Desantisbacteria bacterium]
GTDILEAAIAAGVHINSPCGGKGVCGKCRVKIKHEETPLSEIPSLLVETKTTGLLTKDELDHGFVLACGTIPLAGIKVDIPPSSRLTKEQILTQETKIEHLEMVVTKVEAGVNEKDGKSERVSIHTPLVRKIFLNISPPTIDDHTSDLERVYREINKIADLVDISTSLSNIRLIPKVLRDSNWQVTAIMNRDNDHPTMLSLEAGDTSLRNFGLAIDVGTTTVVVQLVDMNTARVIDTEASYNRQAHYGADVITRIIFSHKKQGLDRLHQGIIDTINDLIMVLMEEHQIQQNEITAAICAGNTTMLHLLLKIDPVHIRIEPYIPAVNFMPSITAAEIGIKINPHGLITCLPHVASYVGADITSGVLASGIHEADEISMLIDIGTNGEIVIGNKDWLVCCASSAGPAFEGGGIKAGIRAMEGAIQRIEINPLDYMVKYDTIGHVKPIGICGSGLIDTLTELLRVKVIDQSGNINGSLPTKRILETEDGLGFVLVWKEDSGGEEDIVITRSDISNLIFSKGAIYTACVVLAKKIGFEVNDIERVYIAGGFGNYLNINKSIMIGLLPDIDRNRYRFIGNSSLSGANLCLISDKAMKTAEEIAKKMTYIELSADNSYMNEYTGALFLPHTDMSRFPRVLLDV